jgi:hypothetical protein
MLNPYQLRKSSTVLINLSKTSTCGTCPGLFRFLFEPGIDALIRDLELPILQSDRVFKDKFLHPLRIHQRETRSHHPTHRMPKHDDLAHPPRYPTQPSLPRQAIERCTATSLAWPISQIRSGPGRLPGIPSQSMSSPSGSNRPRRSSCHGAASLFGRLDAPVVRP